MKKYALLLCLGLAGCKGLEIFKYDSIPVVNSTYKHGATKSSVTAAGGNPLSTVKVPGSNNVCYNYLLKKDGSSSDFFVIFNSQDQVTNYGYTNCDDAIAKGNAKSTEQMKQRF